MNTTEHYISERCQAAAQYSPAFYREVEEMRRNPRNRRRDDSHPPGHNVLREMAALMETALRRRSCRAALSALSALSARERRQAAECAADEVLRYADPSVDQQAALQHDGAEENRTG